MDLRALMSNQGDVSLAIARRVSLAELANNSNLVLSPLSLNVLVSLIASGAGGPALKELLSFLKSDSIDDLNRLSSELVSVAFADGSPAGGPKMAIGNGVWIQEDLPLKPSFQSVVEDFYKAASFQVDFLTKVSNLSLFVVLLMEKQFIRIFESFKVLRLPYKKGEDDERQFSMYIFLPHSRDGLPALVEKLGSGTGFLDEHLPHAKLRVNEFRLPKFKITFGFKTSETLKSLGVSSVFASGGLTEMVDSVEESRKLYVSEIYHKACIEVNEEGTEAAAFSVGVMMTTCYRPPEPPVDFVADHPFMFMIREDKTGVVLFIGHVLNPHKE